MVTKPRGAHPHNRLTVPAIRAAKQGRHADGNGLYLVVSDTGAKHWVLRTTVRGSRTDIGLGSARLVPLGEAREKARHLRKIARDGGDPVAERDKDKDRAVTFEEAARTVHAEHIVPVNKNEKANVQWLAALEREVFPKIGGKSVQLIKQADVLNVLAPVWLTKPETARRIKQRIKATLDWARAKGWGEGIHPVEGIERALPRQPRRTENYAAMPWAEIPAFWIRLEGAGGMGALALRYTILTAARSGEVRGALWPEIDLEAAIWVVPAHRMKAAREHRVPLSAPAVAILRDVRALAGTKPEGLVFPSTKPGKPMSDMTLSAVLKRMDIPVTVHGFRSSFRDWAEDSTSFPHEVKEAALAHAVRDKVEAAYRRTDLFEKRRAMMDAWASFVTSAGGNVVRLGA